MRDKAEMARYFAERLAARKAKGICHSCPEAAVTGQTKCTACVAGAARRHRERKAKGICARCPEAAVAGKVLCAACVAVQERRRQERKAKGICMSCPEAAVTGKTRCVTHSGRSNARALDRLRGDPVNVARAGSNFSRLRQARNAAGLCAACGKEPKRSTSSLGDACTAEKAAALRLVRAARREVGINSRGKPLKGAPF